MNLKVKQTKNFVIESTLYPLYSLLLNSSSSSTIDENYTRYHTTKYNTFSTNLWFSSVQLRLSACLATDAANILLSALCIEC